MTSYRGKQIRKSTEVTDKKLAEKIHAKILTQIAEGKWFDKPIGAEKTFGEMMEKYERERFSELASGSRRGCKSYLDGLVAYFGDYPIMKITPRLINEFKQMRKAEGVKPATVVRQLTIMKRAYNIAIREWEWLDSNPVTKVSCERVNNARDRWLTLEEEGKLLDTCSQWLREIVEFALNTGMRIGEILSITNKAVDLPRRTVTVLKSKNGERRTIPLNDTLFELLTGKAKVKSLKTDLVFYTANQTAYHNANVRRDFELALKKAGIEGFRFHDLRHTFATRLVQSGEDLYRVAKLMGHKDIRMTQRYSHHSTESLRESVMILDSLRRGSTIEWEGRVPRILINP
jgi:integrase